MKDSFTTICYVPGNNEFRIRKDEDFGDSVEKYEQIMELVSDMGIHVKPIKRSNTWIVPLYCWYTPHFSKSFDGDLSYQRRWLDFRRVRWPRDLRKAGEEDLSVYSSYMLAKNEGIRLFWC